jgi:two-component system response regulator RegA
MWGSPVIDAGSYHAGKAAGTGRFDHRRVADYHPVWKQSVAGPADEPGRRSIMDDEAIPDLGADRTLLLVDDDEPFVRRLARAMEKRGFVPDVALSVAEGQAKVTARAPAYAVIDLRLEDGNGLEVVEQLREQRADARIVVLTGYGAIATAVAAVKMGATDYLSKPADANDITNALLSRTEALPEPPENPMSADRVRWEHIQRVFEMCDRNVSETARRLSMHRRTLQRILAKRGPR